MTTKLRHQYTWLPGRGPDIGRWCAGYWDDDHQWVTVSAHDTPEQARVEALRLNGVRRG